MRGQVGLARSSMAPFSRADPFDPDAPPISKNKPLIVGSNRDETNFFFMERHAVDVFQLTNATLEERLQKNSAPTAS